MIERIKNTTNQINISQKNVQFEDESFNLSLFGNGFAVNEMFNDILKDYDTDNNGLIENKEIEVFKNAILKAAGEDKILDTKELNKLFTKSEKTTEFSTKTTALFKALLTVLKNGHDKLKITKQDTGNSLSSINKDDSGVEIYTFKTKNDLDGYVIKFYSKDGKTKELIANNDTEYTDEGIRLFEGEKNLTTHILYNDKEEVVKKTVMYQGDKNTAKYNEYTFNSYDKKGNLIYKTQKSKNFNTGESRTVLSLYKKNELKQKFYTTEKNGMTTTVLTNYDDDKIISKKVKQEKEDCIIVNEYSGENLENRLNYLPNKTTIYDKKGKIKSIETNTFDENGILTGKIVEENNTIKEFDYSKVNGIIEHSKQGGIGDCFLLETINSLNTTDAGRKILNNSIKTSVDENGQTIYKISFKGVPQIIEDLSNGIRNFPKDKIFMKPEYIITEKELEEAALKAGNDYSSGDKDVLLHELAYTKYRLDVIKTIKANNVDISNPPKFISGLDIPADSTVKPENIINGNTLGMTMYLYTGKKSDIYINPKQEIAVCEIDSNGNIALAKKETTYNAISEFSNEDSNVFNKRYNDIDKVLELLKKDIKPDGSFENYIVEAGLNITSGNNNFTQGNSHAFTVKAIKGDKIILINPWNSSKESEISLEDFIKSVQAINIQQM